MAAGMTDLVPRSQTLDLLRGMEEAGAMSATHLDLSGKLDLDIARCEAVARFLGELHDMSKWCIADLMLQAEVRFGEAAYQIAAAPCATDHPRPRPPTCIRSSMTSRPPWRHSMSEINYSVRERGEWLSFRRCVTQLDITPVIVHSGHVTAPLCESNFTTGRRVSALARSSRLGCRWSCRRAD